MKFTIRLAILVSFLLVLNLANAFKVTVKVINGYESKPIELATVRLATINGKPITELITNENGEVIFENVKSKKRRFDVTGATNDYDPNTAFPEGSKDQEITVILYPSYKLESEIAIMEDQQFGKLNFRDLGDSIQSVEDVSTFTAKYPGGDEAMKNFINATFIYPMISKEMGDYGTVVVRFIVEKDGSVSHVKVQKNVSVELDREAIRVVRAMPKWNAGEVNGVKIRMACTLPITANLEY